MEDKSIDDRIRLKRLEVGLEKRPDLKARLKKDLDILELRKQIEVIKRKIFQLR